MNFQISSSIKLSSSNEIIILLKKCWQNSKNRKYQDKTQDIEIKILEALNVSAWINLWVLSVPCVHLSICCTVSSMFSAFLVRF